MRTQFLVKLMHMRLRAQAGTVASMLKSWIEENLDMLFGMPELRKRFDKKISAKERDISVIVGADLEHNRKQRFCERLMDEAEDMLLRRRIRTYSKKLYSCLDSTHKNIPMP